MNNRGQLSLGGLVIVFIGVIVAIALLSPIGDTVGLMSNKQDEPNQSTSTATAYNTSNSVDPAVNISIYSQSAWKVDDCALESVVLRNGVGTALVLTTDYTLDANNGRFSLVNTSKTIPSTALNLTYIDYSYCADGYNKDSGSRTVAGLILIFCALIILAFVLEKTGVTNMGLLDR